MAILHRLSGQHSLCRSCNEIFSNPGNFDRHRKNLNCRPPQSVGLVQVAGVWKRAEIKTPQALVRIRGQAQELRV